MIEIIDTIQDDGSVKRVETNTFDNGDTDVKTTTISAQDYQKLSINTQNQIDDLNKQIKDLTNRAVIMQTNIVQVRKMAKPIINKLK